MKSPFVIKNKSIFDNKYKDIPNRKILTEFEYRFKKLHCDNISLLNDSKLIVKNDLLRIPPDLNLNYWSGIGKAEINISRQSKENSRLIEYKYSYTRFFINFAILFSFLVTSVFLTDLRLEQKIEILILVGTILTSLHIIAFIIILIRHKTVFNGVIRIIKNEIEN